MVQTRLIRTHIRCPHRGSRAPAVRADATICPAFSDTSDIVNWAVFGITARSLSHFETGLLNRAPGVAILNSRRGKHPVRGKQLAEPAAGTTVSCRCTRSAIRKESGHN